MISKYLIRIKFGTSSKNGEIHNETAAPTIRLIMNSYQSEVGIETYYESVNGMRIESMYSMLILSYCKRTSEFGLRPIVRFY